MLLFIICIIVALLQVADFGTSYYCFSNGLGHESNPLIARVIDKLGLFWGLAISKALAVVAVIYIYMQAKEFALVFMIGLLLLYCWVIWNNIKVIRKAQSKK